MSLHYISQGICIYFFFLLNTILEHADATQNWVVYMNLGEINFIALDFKIYGSLHEAMFLLTALEVNERECPWQGKPTNLIRDLRENSVEVFLLVHSQQGTSELMLLAESCSTLNEVQHTTRISLVKCKEQRIIEAMFADCGDFSYCFAAIMKVYDDFFLYKEGIYRHSQKAGSKWKTHSVKLLGWVKNILLHFFSGS